MSLSKLEPSSLWSYFQQICAIPHPSGHEEALAVYICEEAARLGHHVERDRAGNIVVRKAAAAGCEAAPGVILQSHIDMVPQANSDSRHDFTVDPIRAYVDGDWVKAEGTTLGADNGIGVAAMLAVLADPKVVHGPLEALFTIDEERGLTGALNIDPDMLQGSILLNLDTEEEGEIYVGCAGGGDVDATFEFGYVPAPAGYGAVKIHVRGLKGGHSGCDIHRGRGNANLVLAEFLAGPGSALGVKLCEFDGGSLRNAIAREATAVVLCQDPSALSKAVSEFEAAQRQHFCDVEPNLVISVSALDQSLGQVLGDGEQARLLALLQGCPHGLLALSSAFAGVSETSNNLARVVVKEGVGKIHCLTRSLIDEAADKVRQQIRAHFEGLGGVVRFDNIYPGWQPNATSKALARVQETYRTLFGIEAAVKVIHAGLECGILGATYPNWDMVSIGPTIRFPHSPDEQVHIASVAKFWQLLEASLGAFATA